MNYLAKYIEHQGYDLTNNINLDYKIVDVLDPEIHEDATTVESWYKIIVSGIDDYIKLRDFAKKRFISKWDELSDDDKHRLCVNFVYPSSLSQQDLNAILPEEVQFIQWQLVASRSRACREKRWELTRRKASYHLTPANSMDLYITLKDYSLDYKDANIPNLIHWIGNTADVGLGIDFTNNGFAQKPYYTDSLRDLMLDILVNGNYTLPVLEYYR